MNPRISTIFMLDFLHTNLAQIIGFVALVIAVLAFQINQRTKLIIALGAANVLWAVHFYLIGAYTGAAANGVSLFRNYSFIKLRTKYPGARLPAIFISLYSIVVLVTWQGFLSLLPLIGVTVGTIGLWQRKPSRIRQLSLIASPMWLAYNFVSSSYAGVLVEIFIFSSICVAIVRYDILRKPEPGPIDDTLKSGAQL